MQLLKPTMNNGASLTLTKEYKCKGVDRLNGKYAGVIMNRDFSRQKVFLIFGYLVMAVIYLGGCAGHPRHLEKGKEYASLKEWDKSVQFYQKALEERPGDVKIKLMLTRAKLEASMAHIKKGQEYIKEQFYNEAIKEFKISIAINPANRKAGMLFEEARRMKKSEHLYRKGKNYLKAQRYFDARESFKKALELNKENEKARKALAHFKKKDEQPSTFRLKFKSKAPISFKFKKTPIFNVFEVLSKLSGVNFIFDKDIIESNVTMFMTDVSFDRFIEILLKTNKLATKLVNEKTMLIYPDTPVKVKEYRDLQIRTFYLDNLDAKKAVGILSKILKSKNIIANDSDNSVVIRDSKDAVEIASRIITANDRSPAEVLLNVEILEVSRIKEQQLGLEVDPASLTLGIGKEALEIGDPASFSSYASLHALGNISNKEILLSLPTATLYFLKQDGDTTVLAKPQIRVKNNEKATIHIGERIPLRSNRRLDSGTGDVTYDFQYQDIGVKLDVEPTINRHDEISMKLTLEISSIGPNVGTADDPQYSIKTRKVKTVLTTSDGEAVILGGLISDEERQTVRKLPFIGDIPILGRLFSNYETNDSQTDILMSITPIIIRKQDSIGIDFTRIWSGNERNPSLREPFESYIERKEAYQDKPIDAYFEQENVSGEDPIVPLSPKKDN